MSSALESDGRKSITSSNSNAVESRFIEAVFFEHPDRITQTSGHLSPLLCFFTHLNASILSALSRINFRFVLSSINQDSTTLFMLQTFVRKRNYHVNVRFGCSK